MVYHATKREKKTSIYQNKHLNVRPMLGNKVLSMKEKANNRNHRRVSLFEDEAGTGQHLHPDEKFHNLTPEQWQWAVNMIKEFELNEDGARILIEEIRKGNFVFD